MTALQVIKATNESFDSSYPDLTKTKKDFTLQEYSQLHGNCDELTWLAQIGNKDAQKRLKVLADRGYPPAQEGYGLFVLQQGDLEQAKNYLQALRNNHNVSVEGQPVQHTTTGSILSTVIHEKLQEDIKKSPLATKLQEGTDAHKRTLNEVANRRQKKL
ncbi:MAG: hypothetical protein II942_00080 [Alphaproteobacteria bacterium]|nr:hypothetical protein [Alphaproteobacteria bacterium]